MAVTKSARAANYETALHQKMMPWLLITELYWMSYKLLERRFYHLGVSASQARVLAVLHFSKDPIKPSLVATLLFQETQSITGILHRIESRGWITRSPDPHDGRAVCLELTPQGRKVAEQIASISQELYNDLFAASLSQAVTRNRISRTRPVATHPGPVLSPAPS